MDYELVIDVTDAQTQTYMTSIQTLLASVIPQFSVHDRIKYFTSIQLKCNLNPDCSLVLPTLQDLNDTKPNALGGSLVKFRNVERPSMEHFMEQHKRKNLMHKKRMNKKQSSPNSSPSYSSQSQSSSSHNIHSKKNKNRTFISNNRIINNDKQALQSSLPSPRNPNNNHKLQNENENENKNENELDQKEQELIPNTNHSPPPTYTQVLALEHKQSCEPAPVYPDYPSNDMVIDDEETDLKLQEAQDAKVAQELQNEYNHNGNINANLGLSDREWKLQHALVPNHNNDISDAKVDEDYALALQLQQEQSTVNGDEQFALELHKQEELRLQAKVERARNRYRNANFVDYGSQASDYISAHHGSFGRAQAQAQDNDNSDRQINHNYYPIPNVVTGNSDSIEGVGNGNERNRHMWHAAPEDFIMNNGSIPAVYRRILAQQNAAMYNDDVFDIEDVLHMNAMNALQLGGLRRRGRRDDSWQRLPVRTLKESDIAILSKSEEKRSCPICMSDFKVNDKTRQLPCFHEFHKDCVDKWFDQQNDKGKDASCPLDRKKIKDTANQQM